MNKGNVIILHGTGETPDSFWYKYVQNSLGFRTVWLPQLPSKDKPTIKKQVPFIL